MATKRKVVHADQGSARYSVHVDMGERVHSESRKDNPEVPTVLYAEGAYGRKPTVKDWESGRDFHAINPPIWKGTTYFSISEAEFIYSLGYKKIVFGGKEGFDVELVMRP